VAAKSKLGQVMFMPPVSSITSIAHCVHHSESCVEKAHDGTRYQSIFEKE